MMVKQENNILSPLVIAAGFNVFGMILLGGMLRALAPGGACPDWPTCFGAWTPPTNATTGLILDYLHRLAVALSLPLVIGALVTSIRMRAAGWLRGVLGTALALMIVQVLVGAALALDSNAAAPRWLAPVHLLLSLFVLGLLAFAALGSRRAKSSAGFSFRSPFGRISLAALMMLFLLLASGAFVAAVDAGAACSGWPLCEPGRLWSTNPEMVLAQIHRLVVLLSGGLLAWAILRAWRTQRDRPVILVSITAAGVLFLSQALLGARLVSGFPLYMLALHQATALGTWGALAIAVAAAGLEPRSTADELASARALQGRKGLWQDLLQLTKPIVVALLLVTTYAGMVIGAESFPPVGVTLWTLLGGFMAAGGSGAINQYIDRSDDKHMQRTARRPIPSGRLTPAEGLAFGVALALASFFIMVAFVNLLAALLSLAGIFYYVVLYSLILKKTTVQNIVIGGGAGAIPPLVGWAAVTGSLNIPSLFLFAVIFMWTPPHFWALAIVRRQDYARAGVPMLPVVRGESETRRQIFIYTVELVVLTLFLPLFGLGGSVYLVGASILGLWLLAAAWRVWKQAGNKVAWKMYRYSSMYLAFLFVVLMVDALL